ncbi:MAG: hypothetical protein LBF25_02175 [Puniceicoccales bacterium]|nr:hypothetical protein [Puniceicoccales bacterium]
MAKDNLDFNFLFDDFGDQFSYVWSERKGQKYLAGVEDSIHRFYDLYIRSRHISNHIDFIFAKMNWIKKSSCAHKSIPYENDTDVITFHRSPLNIALCAIFAFLENVLDAATMCESSLSLRQYFDIYKSVGAISRESMYGVFSLDSMDYVLATCHFKKTISGVNSVFSMCNDILSSAKDKEDSVLTGMATDLCIAMFDVRELSWQAISFCNSITE